MYSETRGGEEGLRRTKSRVTGTGRDEGEGVGEETGIETTGESGEETGCSSPDSRYLITDIASPPPSPPLFLPRPEQMFAPRCRGQIAARGNGSCREPASCLPSGIPRVHTVYTRACATQAGHRADRARFHADPERSYPAVGSLHPFACTVHFLRQCRLQGGCAFS